MTFGLILGVIALALFLAVAFMSVSRTEKLLAAGLVALTLMHMLSGLVRP